MPTHDILDNRNERLVDHINRILTSTETARFAVYEAVIHLVEARLKKAESLRPKKGRGEAEPEDEP